MSFNFTNDTPIYLQIMEDIKIKIISGVYNSNDKIPSVRELSFKYEANPNTIQKALNELEDMGLIYTERTNGKFVTDNNEQILKCKNETVNDIICDFYLTMEKIGVKRKDVVALLVEKEKEL